MSSVSSAGIRASRSKSADKEPVRIGNPVGDGDDDVAERIGRRLRHQPIAQHVLVTRAGVAHAPLVLAKRPRQKSRLGAHPRRRAIDVV